METLKRQRALLFSELAAAKYKKIKDDIRNEIKIVDQEIKMMEWRNLNELNTKKNV